MNLTDERIREIKQALDASPAEVLALATELQSFRNKYGVSRRTKRMFEPPSEKEVEDYAREIGFKGDFGDYATFAQYFIGWNENRDWMIGGKKMKSWKLAMNTWKTRQKKQYREERSYEPTGLADALRRGR
jgi:hypothetical protein